MVHPSQPSPEVVVIGAGVIGCSIAYHLAEDIGAGVLVLEGRAIASQATARSAGLVLRGRARDDVLRMVARTRDAIAEIEAATGEPVGFSRVGSLRVATAADTAAALQAMDARLRAHGVAVDTLAPADAARLVPWLDASTALHISYVADDGYVDPHRLTWSYARAARTRGARIETGAAVTGLIRDGARVVGVETGGGRIAARWIVDAAGAWAPVVADWIGLGLPGAPVRSHYWITAPHTLTPRGHPVVSLPDARAYARPEVGGLLLGVQEPQSKTYDARALPAETDGLALTDDSADWDLLLRHTEDLRRHVRLLDEFEFAHHIAGLSVYTPDGLFAIGAFDGVAGFAVAGGCCGTGVSASGGIGRMVADIVLGRTPAIDPAPFRPDRFGAIDPFAAEFRARCAAARGAKGRRG